MVKVNVERMAGYSKRAFLEVLQHQQVAIFAYPPEELREELSR